MWRPWPRTMRAGTRPTCSPSPMRGVSRTRSRVVDVPPAAYYLVAAVVWRALEAEGPRALMTGPTRDLGVRDSRLWRRRIRRSALARLRPRNRGRCGGARVLHARGADGCGHDRQRTPGRVLRDAGAPESGSSCRRRPGRWVRRPVAASARAWRWRRSTRGSTWPWRVRCRFSVATSTGASFGRQPYAWRVGSSSSCRCISGTLRSPGR